MDQAGALINYCFLYGIRYAHVPKKVGEGEHHQNGGLGRIFPNN